MYTMLKLAVLAMAAAVLATPASAVQMDPGEIYEFSFDFTADAGQAPWTRGYFTVDVPWKKPGIVVDVTMHDSTRSRSYHFWHGALFDGYDFPFLGKPWTDPRGVVELRVAGTGSFELQHAYLTLLTPCADDGSCTGTQTVWMPVETIRAVPLPATGLLLTALVGIGLLGRRLRPAGEVA